MLFNLHYNLLYFNSIAFFVKNLLIDVYFFLQLIDKVLLIQFNGT